MINERILDLFIDIVAVISVVLAFGLASWAIASPRRHYSHEGVPSSSSYSGGIHMAAIAV